MNICRYPESNTVPPNTNNCISYLYISIYFQTKLIRMVGTQLVAKQKLNVDIVPDVLKDYPKLELWLKIVGIPDSAIKVS